MANLLHNADKNLHSGVVTVHVLLVLCVRSAWVPEKLQPVHFNRHHFKSEVCHEILQESCAKCWYGALHCFGSLVPFLGPLRCIECVDIVLQSFRDCMQCLHRFFVLTNCKCHGHDAPQIHDPSCPMFLRTRGTRWVLL